MYDRAVSPISDSAIRWSPTGALIAAAYDRGDRLEGRVIYKLCNSPGLHVENWNSEPGRTKQDVVALFREAVGDG